MTGGIRDPKDHRYDRDLHMHFTRIIEGTSKNSCPICKRDWDLDE
jgi:hypothetical protein